MEEFTEARQRMVQRQLEARGIRSVAVLQAMGRVPREKFVPADLQDDAYHDGPLPIGAGQTISQPYIVAYMIEALMLQGGETVLEIGTGSGYAAAVLAEIAGEVYTIERVAELADSAKQALRATGYDNVHVVQGDGTLGYPEQAPYQGIVVTAGGPSVPPSLRDQLAVGGHLVIPVGDHRSLQQLIRVTRRSATEFHSEDLLDVRFVPLLGDEGWPG